MAVTTAIFIGLLKTVSDLYSVVDFKNWFKPVKMCNLCLLAICEVRKIFSRSNVFLCRLESLLEIIMFQLGSFFVTNANSND